MNKQELIAEALRENRRAYGRWGSTEKRGASKVALMFQDPPNSDEEVLQHGNALAATGNYPVGTDGCFNVGISGGCGPNCYLYLRGDCEEPQEMLPRLDGDEEVRRHLELYGEPEVTP